MERAEELRLSNVERDVRDHAKSITAIVEDQGELRKDQIDMRKFLDELRTDREVRKERDKNLNERLDRIEARIESVYGIGKWLLAAIGAGMVTAIVTFVVSGGLNVGR